MKLTYKFHKVHNSDMGVSKNRGEKKPKWMVYNGKPYEQIDGLGGKPIIFGSTPIFTFRIAFRFLVFLSPFLAPLDTLWASKPSWRFFPCHSFNETKVAMVGSLRTRVFQRKTARTDMTRWWFQTFLIFTPIWGRLSIWLIFFKWVETTNQMMVCYCSVFFSIYAVIFFEFL